MKTAQPASLPPSVSGSGGIRRSTSASTAAPSAGSKKIHGPLTNGAGGDPASGRQGSHCARAPPPRRSAGTPRFRAIRAGEASSPVLPRKHFTLGQSRLPGNYVFNSHRRPEPRMEDRTPACKDKTSVRSGLTDPCDVPVKGRTGRLGGALARKAAFSPKRRIAEASQADQHHRPGRRFQERRRRP